AGETLRELNVSTWAPGVYLLQLSGKNQQLQRQILVR
ncbi:MAG: T9SS C-terminal target domain-containing protein, partial [Bacteroidetes bacterium]